MEQFSDKNVWMNLVDHIPRVEDGQDEERIMLNISSYKHTIHTIHTIASEWYETINKLTLMILKKSSSVKVSRIFLTVSLATSNAKPFMLPLVSNNIMISFGVVAAWMYLEHIIKHHQKQIIKSIFHSKASFSFPWSNYIRTQQQCLW